MILSLSLVSGHQNNGFHWVFKREHRVFTAFAPVTAMPPWSHLPVLSPTTSVSSLPDSRCCVWVFLMPLNIMVSVSIFLQMAEPYSLLFYFYWVDNTPLCVHDIFSFLFIHSYAPRQTPYHSNSAERHGEHECADAASVCCHWFLWVCT